jgi:hypothetical protein
MLGRETKHLRFAVDAARHWSFRKAVDTLTLGQSKLSRRVRQLNDWVGVILLSSVPTAACDRQQAAGNFCAQLDAFWKR